PMIRAVSSTQPIVDTVMPDIRDVPLRIRESGTVVARNSLQLSPQVGGRVTRMSPNLASGGYFKANQVLFEVDSADYQAAVNRALAEQSAARADLSVERAEASVAREEWASVHPNEPIPDLVARLPQIARAEAALESAAAAVADAQLDLSRVRFSLPFDGRIFSSTIEVGQNLTPGQSYGRAYNPREIEVTVPVTSTVLSALEPAVGRAATVTVGGNGVLASRQHDAIVIRADAELNAQTRLANLTLAFVNPSELLPGEFVSVEIVGPTIASAHLVPERAFGDQRTVWVVDAGRLEQRQPPVLYIRDGQVVSAPFEAGDGIVVSPLLDPSAGAEVRVRSRGQPIGERP
ncbi:MAG: efflux RND transporter periplasmic adaptor subunit, partial [Pseudomonadota bacterium]